MKQEGGLTTWLCFRILVVRTRQHLLSTAFYNFNHFPPYYKHKYILTPYTPSWSFQCLITFARREEQEMPHFPSDGWGTTDGCRSADDEIRI